MPENNPTIALAESYTDMAIARLNEFIEDRNEKFLKYEVELAHKKGYIEAIEEFIKYQRDIIDIFSSFHKKTIYLIEQNHGELPEYYANEMSLLSNFTANKLTDLERKFEELKKRMIEKNEQAAARVVAKAEGSS